MTTIIDQIPLERINAEARKANFGRLLLTLIAGLFYLIGWVAARFFFALAWCGAAVKVGWQEGRRTGDRRGPAR